MRTLLVGLLLFTVLVAGAVAKPMGEATIDEAVRYPLIVVARYEGYDPSARIAYFGGATTHYHVERILKGTSQARRLTVRYEFHDLTPCKELQGWHFDAHMMPARGSEWILFLQPPDAYEKRYSTYRGERGRWPATPENLRKVREAIGGERRADT
jgi:hypothetical protein